MASLKDPQWTHCPGAVDGKHGPTERNGKCPWCRRRIDSPVPSPIPRVALSELTMAYRYYYDPDFGNDRRDVYP